MNAHRALLLLPTLLLASCGSEAPSTETGQDDLRIRIIRRNRIIRDGMGVDRNGVPRNGADLATVVRPCRSDALVLDLALAVEPNTLQSSEASFQAQRSGLEADLQARLDRAWFEDAPLEQRIRVQVRSVLPRRSAPARRADGHKRFLRVSFESGAGQARHLTPLGQCRAVHALRQIRAQYGFGDYYVSRECGTGAQSDWPLQALGADDATTENVLRSATPDSRLVLLDTAVDPGVASTLGIQNLGSRTIPESMSLAHRRQLHGTAMAILARQLTGAEMWSLAVLNEEGAGTPATLAQGLDLVLEQLASGDVADLPTVLNLSLGWPSQLEEEAILQLPSQSNGSRTTPGCWTTEDPIGEPVRYMLDLMRDRDADHPIAVVAAAGNQSLERTGTYFEAPSPGVGSVVPPKQLLVPLIDAESGGHYPGTYARDLTDRGGGYGASLALSVGAMTHRGGAGRTERWNAPSLLVAPGQHVTVEWPGWLGGGPQLPQCMPKPPNVDAQFPKSFVGSSVSSVLAAAVAAEVQALRIESGQDPLRFDPLVRFLVHAGRPSCDAFHPYDPNEQARELQLGTARALVRAMAGASSDSACGAFEACVKENGHPLTDPNFRTCQKHRVGCFGADLYDPSGVPLRCVDFDRGLPDPPAAACPATAVAAAPYLDCSGNTTCDAIPVERTLLGPVGPEPWDPTCSVCRADILGNGETALIQMHIDPPEPSAYLTDISIRFSGRGTGCYTPRFDKLMNLGPLGPGAFELTVKADDLAPCSGGEQQLLSEKALEVDVLVEGKADGVPFTDVSPLLIKGP